MPDSTTEHLWYFGYGSNMSRSIFLNRRGMHPLVVRRGRLDDYQLRFNLPVGPGERGVANLEPQVGACTWGILYLLTADEFDRLDRTEGVHMGAYNRISVEVAADGEESIAAFTYRSSRTRDGRKPSARYMELLLDGAREQKLPAHYLDALARLELAKDERVP